MTHIDATMLDAMAAQRRRGATYDAIAARFGLDTATVYTRLWRAKETLTQPPADARTIGRTDRVTRFVFNNGGCSTLSGPVPVTLPRLACIDGVAA